MQHKETAKCLMLFTLTMKNKYRWQSEIQRSEFVQEEEKGGRERDDYFWVILIRMAKGEKQHYGQVYESRDYYYKVEKVLASSTLLLNALQ